MIRLIKKLYWRLRLRWLESKMKESFNKELSLKIDQALERLN